MCGRFTRYYTWAQIHAYYSLTAPAGQIPNLQPRFNICPTDTVDVVVRGGDDRALVPMRWGLVPSWWSKSLKDANKLATFNARAETIATKPMFRDSFRHRRCLMPVSGYYEWRDTPSGKQPYYFTRTDGEAMTIAAVQDGWVDRGAGATEPLRSCAMVITAPNAFVAEVHDRMPVILERADFEQWERGDTKDAASLMKPAREDVLQKWPVSNRVNSSRAPDGDASLIERDKLDELASLIKTGGPDDMDRIADLFGNK